MSAPTDLYAALGVERDASADEIRKAYRKLARKYHPDVNPGNPEAEDKFKEISAAFEALSDPERRKNYDEFGEESLRSGFDAEKARAYRSWQRSRQETGHPFEAERFHFDLGDLGDLFGGARGRRAPAARRGPDVRARVELDLPTAIRGTQLEVEVPREETCDRCAGAGVEPAQATRCDACDGSGRARVARGPLDLLTACSKCGGSGSLGPACARCGGAGVRRTSRRHKIRVPPGAEDGDTLRIAGKGGSGAAGGEPGDLIIEMAVRPHPLVRRKGRNLYLPLPVTLLEAYAGATIEVPTFDGPVALKVPAGSRPGTKLRLKGKGVERSGERGDLYVELEIAMPKPGDAELAAALERAEALYERPVREEVKL